ncbi:MAG TPA: methyltransferase domain-containing protein [Stellaceae bacterium]|nr:methyltransferase domain-containing protein [Stellaceae bacterium]
MRTELAHIAGDGAQQAQCPRCGGTPEAKGASLVCACGAAGRVVGNVIDWREVGAAQQTPDALWRMDMSAGDNARRLLRAARYCLHPVASPLSPLAWLTRARLDRYYERTRSDPALARDWAVHYLAALPHPAHMSVLDHGTGRGRNLGLLAQLGCKLAAQDIAPHADWARFPACEFQIVPPECDRLPWRTGGFDLVLDWMVLEHFAPERLARLTGEVARVLKSGGFWLVLTANDGSLAARSLRRTLGRLHPPAEVEHVAEAAGLHLVRHSYEGFYAPVFPVVFDAIRKTCAPWPLDLADYRSVLARMTPPRRRAVWVAAYRKA